MTESTEKAQAMAMVAIIAIGTLAIRLGVNIPLAKDVSATVKMLQENDIDTGHTDAYIEALGEALDVLLQALRLPRES